MHDVRARWSGIVAVQEYRGTSLIRKRTPLGPVQERSGPALVRVEAVGFRVECVGFRVEGEGFVVWDKVEK